MKLSVSITILVPYAISYALMLYFSSLIIGSDYIFRCAGRCVVSYFIIRLVNTTPNSVLSKREKIRGLASKDKYIR